MLLRLEPFLAASDGGGGGARLTPSQAQLLADLCPSAAELRKLQEWAGKRAAGGERLGEALRERRVVTFLVVWFGLNLITGLTGSAFGLADATIAWEAHMGGFLVGLLGFRLFDPARP